MPSQSEMLTQHQYHEDEDKLPSTTESPSQSEDSDVGYYGSPSEDNSNRRNASLESLQSSLEESKAISKKPKTTTTLNEAIVPAERDQSSLHIQFFSTEIQAALLQNDKAIPVPLENGNIYPIPLWIALINAKLFIYGNDAMEWVQEKRKSKRRFSANSKYWDLGELLKCNGKLHEEPIVFNDETLKISFEFLLAIYLSHIKDTIEKRMGSSVGSINSVIFIVPLWFGSAQRQRIKDSGTVAGFDNTFLINEITAVALFNFAAVSKCKQQHEQSPEGRRQLVVLNENSGNVDVAVHQIYRDTDGQTTLEMVSCSGNLYESPKSNHSVERNLLKQRYIGNENVENPKTEALVKGLAICLLSEALTKLQGGDSIDIIIHTHDKRWFSILLYAVNRMFCHVPPIIYQPRDSSSIQILSSQLPDNIRELTTYTLFRRDFVMDQFKDPLLAKYVELTEDVQVVSAKIQRPRASTRLVFFQRNVHHRELLVGTLHINMLAYYIYSEIKTSFLVDKNGLIKFVNVFGAMSGSKDFEVIPNEYYTYKGTLVDFEIDNYRHLLCRIVNSFEGLRKESNEKVSILIKKCEEMKCLMDEGWTIIKKKTETEKLIRSRINRGLVLKNIKSPLELAERNIDIMLQNMEKYHRKYLY